MNGRLPLWIAGVDMIFGLLRLSGYDGVFIRLRRHLDVDFATLKKKFVDGA